MAARQKTKRPKKQGVYIMSCTAFEYLGYYKIGISNDPPRRKKQISASMPGSVNVLHFVRLHKAHGIEQWLHRLYANLNATQSEGDGRTEWFDPSQNTIFPVIGICIGLFAFQFLPPMDNPVLCAYLCAFVGWLFCSAWFVLFNIIILRLIWLVPFAVALVILAAIYFAL